MLADGLSGIACGGAIIQYDRIGRLRAKRFPALCAASVDDLAAGFCGHTRTETMAPLAHEVRGLVGAFHRSVSISFGQAESTSAGIHLKPVL